MRKGLGSGLGFRVGVGVGVRVSALGLGFQLRVGVGARVSGLDGGSVLTLMSLCAMFKLCRNSIAAPMSLIISLASVSRVEQSQGNNDLRVDFTNNPLPERCNKEISNLLI